MKKILFVLCFISASTMAQNNVNGYYRQDGNYVLPYHRSTPDGNPYNNYGTQGNVNPYTGKPGTENPYNQYPQR